MKFTLFAFVAAIGAASALPAVASTDPSSVGTTGPLPGEVADLLEALTTALEGGGLSPRSAAEGEGDLSAITDITSPLVAQGADALEDLNTALEGGGLSSLSGRAAALDPSSITDIAAPIQADVQALLTAVVTALQNLPADLAAIPDRLQNGEGELDAITAITTPLLKPVFDFLEDLTADFEGLPAKLAELAPKAA